MCVLSLCRLNSAVIMSLSGASIHVHDWTRDRRPEACQVDGLQQQRYGHDVTVTSPLSLSSSQNDVVAMKLLSQTVSSTLYQLGNLEIYGIGFCRPGALRDTERKQ